MSEVDILQKSLDETIRENEKLKIEKMDLEVLCNELKKEVNNLSIEITTLEQKLTSLNTTESIGSFCDVKSNRKLKSISIEFLEG